MKIVFVFTLLLLVALVGCNKAEDNEVFYSVSGSASFVDPEYWPSVHAVKVGLFQGNNMFPVYSTEIEKPVDGDSVEFKIDEIVAGTYDIRLFIAENNKNKADLALFNASLVDDNVLLENQTVQLNTYSRIQAQVFNSCLQCHGAADAGVAADLFLLPDSSYNQIVDVHSVQSEKLRVKPASPNESFLMQVLKKEDLSFDHPASITATDGDIEFVEQWILKGALND